MKLPIAAKAPPTGFSRAARVAMAAAALQLLGATGDGLPLLRAQDRGAATSPQTVAATGVTQPPESVPRPRVQEVETREMTETQIVARDGAEFDARGRAATFNGSVHISDPRFELWCDRLTVYLNREAEKEEGDTGSASNPRPAPRTAGNQPPSGGGIDRAVAEGNVVIKQTRPATGPGGGGEAKTAIGRAERAEFTNRTGQVVLSGGRPSIEQGLNVLEATSSQTRIILARDNTLRTEGPSRTVIRQRGDAAAGFTGPDRSPPAAGAVAPTTGAETPKPRPQGTRRPNR